MVAYSKVDAVATGSSYGQLSPLMMSLMLRNMSTDGYRFEDPTRSGVFSLPGCVIASPSFPANLGTVDQDYVFSWVRDSALVVAEIARASYLPSRFVTQRLADYVRFAAHCQSGTPTIGRACYRVDGTAREWSDQSDGPALRTITLLDAWQLLDADTQAVARTVVQRDLDYLLSAYESATTSLWEEVHGQSFFARSVQLECFRRVDNNSHGLAVPPGIPAAIVWLEAALDSHWDGGLFVSVLADQPTESPESARTGYDPNIDVLLAALYGALPVTDARLLATVAQLRGTFADPSSNACFPLNIADSSDGRGPLMGRYPTDTYDGDVSDATTTTGHPWPLCSTALAQLYYELASALTHDPRVLADERAHRFFDQVGAMAPAAPDEVRTRLIAAGDSVMQAVIFHSDHLQLSEQFDAVTGYEKSVDNLTWSYASFLSATRIRALATGD